MSIFSIEVPLSLDPSGLSQAYPDFFNAPFFFTLTILARDDGLSITFSGENRGDIHKGKRGVCISVSNKKRFSLQFFLNHIEVKYLYGFVLKRI
jgi:hypothetical protein